MPVKAREHHDRFWVDDVEQAVRKATQQRASNVAVDLRVGLRVSFDRLDALVDRPQELFGKVKTSLRDTTRERRRHQRRRRF